MLCFRELRIILLCTIYSLYMKWKLVWSSPFRVLMKANFIHITVGSQETHKTHHTCIIHWYVHISITFNLQALISWNINSGERLHKNVMKLYRVCTENYIHLTQHCTGLQIAQQTSCTALHTIAHSITHNITYITHSNTYYHTALHTITQHYTHYYILSHTALRTCIIHAQATLIQHCLDKYTHCLVVW